jgi:hypothetical protein
MAVDMVTAPTRFADFAHCADTVIDTVGGESQDLLFAPKIGIPKSGSGQSTLEWRRFSS